MDLKRLFGLIFIFISNLVFTLGNHHEKITISPSTSEVIHYVNDSHIVTCNGNKDAKVRWLNPKGEPVTEKKGRIHIEEMQGGGQLALVFGHIALSDKGTWSCILEEGEGKKSFKMFVNQPISFMDTPIVQSAPEGEEATIRCEVKGDPEPKVSWYFNGQQISFSHKKFIKLGDGLRISKVSRNDSGEYTCRAYQISEKINSVEDKTIRLNIQHKPIAPRKASADVQYGYRHGIVNLTCEAEAEPQANFTWYHAATKLSPKTHQIYTGNHTSMLQIFLNDTKVFGDYRCKATNHYGTLDRIINLQEGVKPEKPTQFALRGVNSDTFDIDVGAMRSLNPNERRDMDINGYRFEIMSEHEYQNNGGRWETARVLVVGFEDGMTYLINNLASNTTYVVRVASRNPAGYSDWTDVQKWSTYAKEPTMFSASNVNRIFISDFLQIFSLIGISLLENLSTNLGYRLNSIL